MEKDKTPYQRKLSHPDWQKKRLEVMQRDEFSCQECGATDKELHIHHKYYDDSIKSPQDYPLEALITLCHECHSEEENALYNLSKTIIPTLRRCGANAEQIAVMLHYIKKATANGLPVLWCGLKAESYSRLSKEDAERVDDIMSPHRHEPFLD